MKLFISYTRVDEYLVRTQIVDILRAANHDPWFDHRLIPGRDWQQQLLEAIVTCDAFLYAMTPESLNSEWCRWEFSKAVALDKPIIPVLLQKTTVPTDLGSLHKLQYVDFTRGADGPSVAKLMAGLQTISDSQMIRAPRHPQGAPAQAVSDDRGEIRVPSDSKFERLNSTSPNAPATTTIRRLNAQNPVDWLSLYLWLFFRPHNLIAHRRTYDEQSEKQVGAWLSSTLTWLPYALITLPTTWRLQDGSFRVVFLIMMLGWLTTGFLATSASLWNFVVIVGVAVGMVLGVANEVVFGVAIGIAGIVVFIVAGKVAFSTVFALSFAISFAITLGVAVDVTFSVIFGVASGVAVGVALALQNSLTNEKLNTSLWLKTIGILIPFSYIIILIVASLAPFSR